MKKLVLLVFLAATASLPAITSDELVQVLQSDATLEEKSEACRELATVGDESAIPILAELLDHKDLAHMARYALEPMPFDLVDKALRRALNRLKGLHLVGAIHTIGVRRDPGAVPQLAALAKHPDQPVAAAARTALARIATPASIKALSAPLNKLAVGRQWLKEGRRVEAARIFRELVSAPAPEEVKTGAWLGLLQAEPERAGERLLDLQKTPNHRLQRAALAQALLLGDIPLKAISPTHFDVLANSGDPMFGELFRAHLGSPDPDVCIPAIRGLAALSDQASAYALCRKMLDSDSNEVRLAAYEALAGIPGDTVGDAIEASLPKASVEDRVRCIGLLALRRDTRHIELLVKEAGHPDPKVGTAAIKALTELAEAKHLQALTGLLVTKGKKAESLIVAVAKRSEDEASRADAVLALLKITSDTTIQNSCLRVLGGIANGKALAKLQAALANPKLGDTALRELTEWPDGRALLPLLAHLAKLKNAKQRILTIQGCARMVNPGDAESYKILLAASERPEEKKLLLAGLGNSASRNVIPLIEPMLSDEGLRAEAELALKTIRQNVRGAEQARAYITAWQVSNPYRPGDANFDKALPPERNEGTWKTLAAGKSWMMDLHKGVRGGPDQVCYTRTAIHSDQAMKARIDFGTDDGSKVWVNHKLVHSDITGGAATPGEHKVPVELKAGWNFLLMKISQISGPWQFCLRVTDEQGVPFKELRVDPAQWPEGKPTPKATAPSGSWTSLLPNLDMDGWNETGDAIFKIEDGCLVGTQTNGKGGDIWTDKNYDNFELRITYKMTWPGNSGFWFRWNGKQGYQFDVLDYKKPRALTGSLYCHGKMFLTTNLDASLEDREGWNEARILAVGDEIGMWLNGRQVSKITDDTFSNGKLGIQIHGGEKFKGMKMIVKRLEIR